MGASTVKWQLLVIAQVQVQVQVIQNYKLTLNFILENDHEHQMNTLIYKAEQCTWQNIFHKALVENMAKKNRNHFAIVVLLTTMLCTR